MKPIEKLKMFHVYFYKSSSQGSTLEKHGFYFVAPSKEEALRDFSEYAQTRLGESLKSEDITVEEQVMDEDITITKEAHKVTISCS